MKIVTNKNYAVCNPRKPYRTGVIVGGSNSALGPCVIHLDGDKLPRAMTLNLFDVVKWSDGSDIMPLFLSRGPIFLPLLRLWKFTDVR
jgi:hypothetical protein